MSNDYFQLRKDVDRIKWFITGLQLQLQDIGVDGLKELFEEFSQNTGSNDDLYDDLDTLDNDLTDLSTRIDEFSLELYGDNNNEGLVDYLHELQELIYGEGQTYTDANNVVHDCTIQNPCANSLKGMLNTFRTELNSLTSDNNNLQYTLSVLTTYLNNFTGTLNQFKTQLSNNGINYSELDTGITQLLEAIFNTQNAVNTVDNRVTNVNTLIGNSNDSGNSTLYGLINNTSDTADNASEKADNLEKITYKGTGSNYNANATVGSPANGSLKKLIDTAQDDIDVVQNTDIPAVKNKMGFSSIGNTSLQDQIFNIQDIADFVVQTENSWQILYYGALDSITLNTLVQYTGVSLHNIHYAYNNGYKVNDGIGWVSYDGATILNHVEFAGIVCDGVNSTVQSFARSIGIDDIYDVTSSSVYHYSAGTWQQLAYNDLDYYQKRSLMKLFPCVPYNGVIQPQKDVNTNLQSSLNGKADSSHSHSSWDLI